MGWSDEYLEHHGILGQKWGVRRFETESGHLTAAGKARYDDYEYAKSQTKKAKEALVKANEKANSSYSQQDLENAQKAKGMYNLRKKQESDAKAKIKMNAREEAGKKVGKREQKLIEKYKKEGMSEDEAAVAAYKRAKLEKTLAIAAGVTVAAAATYGAKKYHDYVTDEVLEVGKINMKRIENNNNKDLYDTFYASFGKSDVQKYEGLYGNQIKSQVGGKVYQKSIDLKENIKIASDKNSKNAMAEVFSKASPETKKEFIDQIESRQFGGLGKQGRTLKKGIADIKAGKYDTKAAYDAFNINMTGGNQAQIYKDFKSNLKDKGYSGVKDRNDADYSGYKAKTARIIFDNSKVKVSDVREVTDAEVKQKLDKVVNKMALTQYAKLGAVAAGAITASNKVSQNRQDNKAIADYKKEHPNTKLSRDEILENYYGGKK